jgi:integrase
VLEPIWRDKTETASRLRGRIESVLDWATTRGYREGANPARWKGHLDNQLAAPTKVAKVEHHAALDLNAAPGFLSALRQQNGMGARALEFAILTAARSGEVRGATWEEIDLDEAVWTVPAERMKAGKEHRVPLSRAALKLLKTQRPVDDDEAVGLVFPAPRGGVLSDMTLSAVLRRMKVDAVPHGFRSTFRDWAAERTNYPRDVVEMALAHAIGDKVEAAYRRGDLFDKRRRLMTDWASFLATTIIKGNVVPMPKSKKA